jgi:quercetin dioxygenase-like cupin family protein
MTLNVRRIVTGHDEDGKAIVTHDEVMENISQLRSGNFQTLIWKTEDTPCDVDGDEDPATQELDIEPPAEGSIFRILELVPGKDAYMHRTDTIDYAICMSGECVMIMDDDLEIDMKTGDVMVQRGTWHGWANRSDKPCVIAFILIGSQPPAKHLHPHE